MPNLKTTRLARSAATGLLGLVLPSTAFAEAGKLPETRQRIMALAEAQVAGMLPAIKGQIVDAAAGIRKQMNP